MKASIWIISILVLVILAISCEENFSPKTNFQEKYILYSIINTDSSIQTAVLQKSYDVEGFDPYLNNTDPSVQGADIRLIQGENVFFMHDTSIARSDTSRYKTPLHFYYISDFSAQTNYPLEIMATLPNGKKLYGTTDLPVKVEFDTSSDRSLPPEDKDLFSFAWNGGNSQTWFLPKFTFYYIKNGVRYGKDVPSEYRLENGNWIPIYPGITNNSIINFRISALDSAFNQISQGDQNKSNYEIFGGIFTLLVFNENLSNYYSTTNGFLDDFTVRIDEADYSNIDGGLGIFGSYLKQRTGAIFTEEYIRSFGYTSGFD